METVSETDKETKRGIGCWGIVALLNFTNGEYIAYIYIDR